MRISRLVTTFCGIGLLRPAPGTWGSAAAIPVGWVLHGLGGFPLLALATLFAVLGGIKATEIEIRGRADQDPAEIVIDEVAGMWIALWPLSLGLWLADAAPWVFPYPGWIGAFVLFRLFDIWKPGPIGWADRRGGAMGVMLDDIVAGVFAAVIVAFAAWVAHGMLM